MEYTVEGTTYAPTGAVTDSHGRQVKLTPGVVKLAEVAALCNDSKIVYNQVSCFVPLKYGINSQIGQIRSSGRTDRSGP